MRKSGSTIHLSQLDRPHTGVHGREGGVMPAAQIKLLIPSFETFRLQDFVSWFMKFLFRRVSRGEILLQHTPHSWQVLQVLRQKESAAHSTSAVDAVKAHHRKHSSRTESSLLMLDTQVQVCFAQYRIVVCVDLSSTMFTLYESGMPYDRALVVLPMLLRALADMRTYANTTPSLLLTVIAHRGETGLTTPVVANVDLRSTNLESLVTMIRKGLEKIEREIEWNNDGHGRDLLSYLQACDVSLRMMSAAAAPVIFLLSDGSFSASPIACTTLLKYRNMALNVLLMYSVANDHSPLGSLEDLDDLKWIAEASGGAIWDPRDDNTSHWLSEQPSNAGWNPLLRSISIFSGPTTKSLLAESIAPTSHNLTTYVSYTIPYVDIAKLIGVRVAAGFKLEELKVDGVQLLTSNLSAFLRVSLSAVLPTVQESHHMSARLSIRVGNAVNVCYNVQFTPRRTVAKLTDVCMGTASVRIQVPEGLQRHFLSPTAALLLPYAATIARDLVQRVQRIDGGVSSFYASLTPVDRGAAHVEEDGKLPVERAIELATIPSVSLKELCECSTLRYFDKTEVKGEKRETLIRLLKSAAANKTRTDYIFTKLTDSRFFLRWWCDKLLIRFIVDVSAISSRMVTLRLFFFATPLELRVATVAHFQRLLQEKMEAKRLVCYPLQRDLQAEIVLPSNPLHQFARSLLLSYRSTHDIPPLQPSSWPTILRQLVDYRRALGRHAVLRAGHQILLCGFAAFPDATSAPLVGLQIRVNRGIFLQTLISIVGHQVEVAHWVEPAVPTHVQALFQVPAQVAMEQYAQTLWPIDDRIITLHGTMHYLAETTSAIENPSRISVTLKQLRLLLEYGNEHSAPLILHHGLSSGHALNVLMLEGLRNSLAKFTHQLDVEQFESRAYFVKVMHATSIAVISIPQAPVMDLDVGAQVITRDDLGTCCHDGSTFVAAAIYFLDLSCLTVLTSQQLVRLQAALPFEMINHESTSSAVALDTPKTPQDASLHDLIVPLYDHHAHNFVVSAFVGARQGQALVPNELNAVISYCTQQFLDVDITNLWEIKWVVMNSSIASSNACTDEAALNEKFFAHLDTAFSAVLLRHFVQISESEYYAFRSSTSQQKETECGVPNVHQILDSLANPARSAALYDEILPLFVRFSFVVCKESKHSLDTSGDAEFTNAPSSDGVEDVSEHKSMTAAVTALTELERRTHISSEYTPRVVVRLECFSSEERRQMKSFSSVEAITRVLEPFRRAVETFCAEDGLETLTKSDTITRSTLHMVQQSFMFAPAVQHLVVPLEIVSPGGAFKVEGRTLSLDVVTALLENEIEKNEGIFGRLDHVFYLTSWPSLENSNLDMDATVPFWLLFSLGEAAQPLSTALPGAAGKAVNETEGCFTLDAQASLFIPGGRNSIGLRNEVTQQFVDMLQRACVRLNQFLLLQELHETRQANGMLIPSHEQLSADNLSAGVAPVEEARFACALQKTVSFPIHSRVQPDNAVLRLETEALHHFMVANRPHYFVYRSSSGAVFYFRLDAVGSTPTASRSAGGHEIVLSLFGIDPVDETLTAHLQALVTSKLVAVTVQVLSGLLQRNPKFHLQGTDYTFLKQSHVGASHALDDSMQLQIPHFIGDMGLFVLMLQQAICRSPHMYRLYIQDGVSHKCARCAINEAVHPASIGYVFDRARHAADASHPPRSLRRMQHVTVELNDPSKIHPMFFGYPVQKAEQSAPPEPQVHWHDNDMIYFHLSMSLSKGAGGATAAAPGRQLGAALPTVAVIDLSILDQEGHPIKSSKTGGLDVLSADVEAIHTTLQQQLPLVTDDNSTHGCRTISLKVYSTTSQQLGEVLEQCKRTFREVVFEYCVERVFMASKLAQSPITAPLKCTETVNEILRLAINVPTSICHGKFIAGPLASWDASKVMAQIAHAVKSFEPTTGVHWQQQLAPIAFLVEPSTVALAFHGQAAPSVQAIKYHCFTLDDDAYYHDKTSSPRRTRLFSAVSPSFLIDFEDHFTSQCVMWSTMRPVLTTVLVSPKGCYVLAYNIPDTTFKMIVEACTTIVTEHVVQHDKMTQLLLGRAGYCGYANLKSASELGTPRQRRVDVKVQQHAPARAKSVAANPTTPSKSSAPPPSLLQQRQRQMSRGGVKKVAKDNPPQKSKHKAAAATESVLPAAQESGVQPNQPSASGAMAGRSDTSTENEVPALHVLLRGRWPGNFNTTHTAEGRVSARWSKSLERLVRNQTATADLELVQHCLSSNLTGGVAVAAVSSRFKTRAHILAERSVRYKTFSEFAKRFVWQYHALSRLQPRSTRSSRKTAAEMFDHARQAKLLSTESLEGKYLRIGVVLRTYSVPIPSLAVERVSDTPANLLDADLQPLLQRIAQMFWNAFPVAVDMEYRPVKVSPSQPIVHCFLCPIAYSSTVLSLQLTRVNTTLFAVVKALDIPFVPPTALVASEKQQAELWMTMLSSARLPLDDLFVTRFSSHPFLCAPVGMLFEASLTQFCESIVTNKLADSAANNSAAFCRLFDAYPLAATDDSAGSMTYFARDRLDIRLGSSIPLSELFPFIAARADTLNFFVVPSHDQSRPMLALAIQTEQEDALRSFHLAVLRIAQDDAEQLEAMVLSMSQPAEICLITYESPLEHVRRHILHIFSHLSTEFRHHQAWQTLHQCVQQERRRGFLREELPGFVKDLLRLSNEVFAERIDPALQTFYRQTWSDPARMVSRLSDLFAEACVGRCLLLQPSDTEFIILLISPSSAAVHDILYALLHIGEDHPQPHARNVLQLQQLSLLQQRQRTIDSAQRHLLSEFLELLLMAAL